MFGLYITHPQIRIDPNIPVPHWGLSDIGRARAEAAATKPWAKALGRVISSAEVKAVETAEILARASGLAIEIADDSHENDRSATGFLPPADFEKAADLFFAHPHISFRGWERAIDAQSRIVSAVSRILSDHDPRVPVAFVGHGGVGTLLKCFLEGKEITREGDQPAGGGHLYRFSLADRAISCNWTPIEDWQGEPA